MTQKSCQNAPVSPLDKHKVECYTFQMQNIRYIAVEGPIGVGKTTLATMLAEDFDGKLVLEEVAQNPFLSSFYANREQFAFQVQLFFLLSRYKQMQEIKQIELFNQVAVSDYFFAKDQIFASMNLSQEEMDLYDKVFELLDAKLPKPDVVIFLQANPEILMKRIKKRKASYENDLKGDYVEELAQVYNKFFFQYADTPLLVVNTSGTDFVNNRKDYEILKQELYRMMKSGMKKHYVTIDSR